MARIYTFRGKAGDELRKMSIDQYLQMLTSRQRRAYKRMSLSYRELLAKVAEAQKSGDAKAIKTHTREAVILPNWLGMRFAVHNGKEFKEMVITEEMLGHRLGEFSFTTKRVLHSAPGVRATRGSKFLAVK